MRDWNGRCQRCYKETNGHTMSRRIDQHQGYSGYNTGPSTWPTGTASGGNGHGELIHTWIPYYVEVVPEPAEVT